MLIYVHKMLKKNRARGQDFIQPRDTRQGMGSFLPTVMPQLSS